jgi:hypothetical protein
MTGYNYGKWVKTLSERLKANLSTVDVEHNFEYGPEFEVVICKTLRSVLPDKYGVCRGYVIDAKGNKAGDDIIIFDRHRFPTVALRDRDDFSRKESVPIEAVYCYIEAKHTINLEGDDPQSLFKACQQIANVKRLCATREAVPYNQIQPHLNIGLLNDIFQLQVNPPPDFPTILNPVFSVFFARYVRQKNGEKKLLGSSDEILSVIGNIEIESDQHPDLIVLGDNVVINPVIANEKNRTAKLRSPFFLEGRSLYYLAKVDGTGFGIGLLSMMYALDWIRLGVMPWNEILVDALGLPYIAEQ